MRPRYLVTGAQGFIGRYMVSHLLAHHPQCTVLGAGRSPQKDTCFSYFVSSGKGSVAAPVPMSLRNAIGPRYRYVSADLSSQDFADALANFRPTKVIHLAATLRGASDETIFQNNVQSTAALLQAMRKCDVETLLFVSTGGVYGNQANLPVEETASVQPLDSYSCSKLAGEELVRQFALESGIPTTITRIFNVCGPGQDEHHFAGRIANQLASILARQSEPIVQVGSLSSTRDYLDVRDVCHGLAMIPTSNPNGICNVASGVETKIGDLLEWFLDVTGLKEQVQIVIDADRVDTIPRQVANVDRLAKLGFAPQYSLQASCQDMVAHCSRYLYETA